MTGTPRLGPDTEDAAERLVRHVRWAEGFWLAYVFTIDLGQSRILYARAGRALSEVGREQRLLQPKSPQALEVLLDEILDLEPVGCTWVEVVRDPKADQGAWTEAWIHLVLRTNERRELVRERLRGGLVFVAHPGIKSALREAGPDLWSIRSRVFELSPGPGPSELDPSLRILPEYARPPEWVDAELLDAELRRFRSASDDELEPAVRAQALLTLSKRLSGTNREASAQVALEAVELYRDLVDKPRSAGLPLTELSDTDQAALDGLERSQELAASLTNLGSRLFELGRREEALAVTQEAVECYQRQAQARLDVLPDLAGSLNNRGMILSSLGRREEALATIQEVVETYRQRAQAQPGEFLPDLAMSLKNLGMVLSELGRGEEALDAARESVDIRRKLARDRPEAFLPDLASSLTTFGMLLNNLGRTEEAFAAIEEAVEFHRQLALAQPEVFRPNLAASLTNLGLSLSGLGRREEALAATEEAVDINRQLALARPEAFLPYLAKSLGAYGAVELEAGEPGRAAALFAEGLRAVAPLRETQPGAVAHLIADLADHYQLACDQSATEPAVDLVPLLTPL